MGRKIAEKCPIRRSDLFYAFHGPKTRRMEGLVTQTHGIYVAKESTRPLTVLDSYLFVVLGHSSISCLYPLLGLVCLKQRVHQVVMRGTDGKIMACQVERCKAN